MGGCRDIARYIRHACAAALVLMLLAPFSAARAADRFVAGLEDLPLMPGLAPVEGAGLVFDDPQGRIVDAYAKGKTSRDDVLRFYGDTLPQLGWSKSAPGEFHREGERLRIEFKEKAGELTVRFFLSPG
jgi:hypothetical protein